MDLKGDIYNSENDCKNETQSLMDYGNNEFNLNRQRASLSLHGKLIKQKINSYNNTKKDNKIKTESLETQDIES